MDDGPVYVLGDDNDCCDDDMVVVVEVGNGVVLVCEFCLARNFCQSVSGFYVQLGNILRIFYMVEKRMKE
jgi:hypothetical protein